MADGNRYALIIGNSQYNDKTLSQLATPQLDALALADVLRNPAIGAFNKVEIFLDEENHYLRREIERFFARSDRDDTLLLYFSGHGVRDELSGELYLATIDTEPEYLYSTAVPAEFIRRVIRKSRAERKILIFDSCFSGAVTSEMLAKGEANVAVCQQFGRGVVILTASTALQRAFQGDTIKELRKGGQSVFTHFLVEGLKTGEAAQGDNPFITISDLFRYAERQMWYKRPDQTPQMTGIEQQGEIVIAKSVKPRKVALPVGVARLLRSSLRGDLLSAIDDLLELAKRDDKALAELAIQELQKLTSHKIAIVQNAANTALEEVGWQLPEAPIPLVKRVWAYVLSHPVILITVATLVVIGLVGSLSYPTVVAWLNSTPSLTFVPIVTPTSIVTITPDMEVTEIENRAPIPIPTRTSTRTPRPPTATNTPRPTATLTQTPTKKPTSTNTPIPTTTPIPIEAVLYDEDFEDGAANSWGTIVGDWSIQEEEGNHFWRGTGPENYPQAWLDDSLVDVTNWTDYAFESRIRFIKGGVFMCVRAQGGTAFYNAFIKSEDDWLSFADYDSERADNGYQDFGGTQYTIITGRWYKVRFEVQGDTLRLYIDDKLVNTAQRSTWKQGGIGYYMGGGDEIHFDDIRVWRLATQSPTRSPVAPSSSSENVSENTFLYTAPTNLRFSQTDNKVSFSWEWNNLLKENEFFELRIWSGSGPHWGGAEPTKAFETTVDMFLLARSDAEWRDEQAPNGFLGGARDAQRPDLEGATSFCASIAVITKEPYASLSPESNAVCWNWQ
jgi:uncharacterized caspase-like protein